MTAAEAPLSSGIRDFIRCLFVRLFLSIDCICSKHQFLPTLIKAILVVPEWGGCRQMRLAGVPRVTRWVLGQAVWLQHQALHRTSSLPCTCFCSRDRRAPHGVCQRRRGTPAQAPGVWGPGIHLSPFFFFFLFPSVPLFPFLSLHLWMYIWRQKLCADAQRRETQPLSPDTSQLHWGRGYMGTDLKRRMQAGGALGGRRGGRRAGGAAVLERSWVLQSGTLSEESYPHTGAGPSRVSGASPALPDFP